MEAAIETPSRLAQIAVGVLEEVERVMGAIQRALEIAEHDIDPAGAIGFAGCLAGLGDDHGVRVVLVDHGAECAEAIAVDLGTRDEMGLAPVLDSLLVERRHRRDHRTTGMTLGIRFHGNQERPLVFRAAPGLAAGQLATEVGVIDLDDAAELAPCLAVGHRLHQLVLHPPGAPVTHPQVALERQRREAVLAVREQVERQEPGAQGQLAAGKHGAGTQTGLGMAATALPVDLAEAPEAAGMVMATARADEAGRPARLAQRTCARRFGAEGGKELGERQTRLELDTVHAFAGFGRYGHGGDLGGNVGPAWPADVSDPATVLKISANQVP